MAPILDQRHTTIATLSDGTPVIGIAEKDDTPICIEATWNKYHFYVDHKSISFLDSADYGHPLKDNFDGDLTFAEWARLRALVLSGVVERLMGLGTQWEQRSISASTPPPTALAAHQAERLEETLQMIIDRMREPSAITPRQQLTSLFTTQLGALSDEEVARLATIALEHQYPLSVVAGYLSVSDAPKEPVPAPARPLPVSPTAPCISPLSSSEDGKVVESYRDGDVIIERTIYGSDGHERWTEYSLGSVRLEFEDEKGWCHLVAGDDIFDSVTHEQLRDIVKLLAYGPVRELLGL